MQTRRLLTVDEREIWRGPTIAPVASSYVAATIFALLGIFAIVFVAFTVSVMAIGGFLKLTSKAYDPNFVIAASLVITGVALLVAIVIFVRKLRSQKNVQRDDELKLLQEFDITRYKAFGAVRLVERDDAERESVDSPEELDCMDSNTYVIDIGDSQILFLQDYHCIELDPNATRKTNERLAPDELDVYRELNGHLFGAILGGKCLDALRSARGGEFGYVPDSGTIIKGSLLTLHDDLKQAVSR